MQLIPAFKIGVANTWIFAVCFFLISFLIISINKKVTRKLGNPLDMKLTKKEKVISNIASIISYIAFIYSFFLPFKLKTIWFYTGLVVFLIAVAILMAAGIYFITTPIDMPVTRGIYRYSRHPMYVANFLAIIAIGIASASWLIFLLAALFLISANIVVVSEERYCKEKYGDAYIEYFNRTPKLIGIPKSIKR